MSLIALYIRSPYFCAPKEHEKFEKNVNRLVLALSTIESRLVKSYLKTNIFLVNLKYNRMDMDKGMNSYISKRVCNL